MATQPKTLISVDVETTGSYPPKNSMLSLGAVAFSFPKGVILDHFSKNLHELPRQRPRRGNYAMVEDRTASLEEGNETAVRPTAGDTRFRDVDGTVPTSEDTGRTRGLRWYVSPLVS